MNECKECEKFIGKCKYCEIPNTILAQEIYALIIYNQNKI